MRERAKNTCGLDTGKGRPKMRGFARSPNFARACISLSMLSLTEISDNWQRKEILAA